MKEDADIILSIPVFEGMVDTVAWHDDAKGCFSAKSAYMLAIRKRDHLKKVSTEYHRQSYKRYSTKVD